MSPRCPSPYSTPWTLKIAMYHYMDMGSHKVQLDFMHGKGFSQGYKVCPWGVPFVLKLTLKAGNLTSCLCRCAYSHSEPGFYEVLMLSSGLHYVSLMCPSILQLQNVSPKCPSLDPTDHERFRQQWVITWVSAVTRCHWVSCINNGFRRATRSVPQVSLSN